MQAMIRNPARGMSGAIENRPEDQELFDDRVGFERLVREHAVIANRGTESAECSEEHRQTEDFEAWDGKKDQADNGQDVNEDQIGENAFLAVNGLPKRTVPRLRLRRLLRQADFHVISDDLQN